MIPYSRQWIDDEDVAAVAAALRGDYLTTGPRVAEFEAALAWYCGTRYAVAFSSGTAALHAAYATAGVARGEIAITTPITFCATANAVLHAGGVPVFADVGDDGLLHPVEAAAKATYDCVAAVVPVDLAGHPADYDAFRARPERWRAVIADACHSLGATYHGRKVGTLADMTVFSFHAVKAITTGEGGAVATDGWYWRESLRELRDHGLNRAALAGALQGDGTIHEFSGMQRLGYNYRMTDFQAALGLSQLRKLDRFIARRREIAARYTEAWAGLPHVRLPDEAPDCQSAWHLYVLRVDWAALGLTRQGVRDTLAAAGVGTQVHYVPVYRHPYYQAAATGVYLPNAERYFADALSVPLYPAMTDAQVETVIASVGRVLA